MISSMDAGVVVDIEAEIGYWEAAYPNSDFHRADFVFKDYVGSLKFAYDAYLRFYRRPFIELLPELRQKYEKDMSGSDRLDWERMVCLLRSVWTRTQQLAAETSPKARAVKSRRTDLQPLRSAYS